jgi:hypothetical protein
MRSYLAGLQGPEEGGGGDSRPGEVPGEGFFQTRSSRRPNYVPRDEVTDGETVI